MSNNLMHQTLEDQFLHWLQEMERKQEEQARQMQELQACVERTTMVVYTYKGESNFMDNGQRVLKGNMRTIHKPI